jgi:hypothetical protein
MIAAAFDQRSTLDKEFRGSIGNRARNIAVGVREPDLRAFCLRLADANLSDPEWLDSVASYIASSPPIRWRGQVEQAFKDKLDALAEKFRRVEAMAFRSDDKSESESLYRLTLTSRDGEERDRVVFATAEDVRTGDQLVSRLSGMINQDRGAALYALSRLTWDLLETKNGN